MNGWIATLRVAAWEFRRLFRWRDQLMGFVMFVVLGVGWLGIQALIELSGDEKVRLATTGFEPWGTLGDPPDGFSLEPLTDAEEARSRVDAGELDGWVAADGTTHAQVYVQREPAWRGRLSNWLDREARRTRIESAQLTTEAVDDLLAPVALDVAYADQEDAEARRAVRPALILFLVLMVMGLFTGNAYLFTGITGEKQQRMTEQILAILPPQRWIDGKILGIVGMVAVSLSITFVSLVAVNGGLNLLGTGVQLQLDRTSLWLLASFFAYSSGGFILWFAFFGAVAATINDPNSSSRSSMMFLPVLPAIFVLAVIKNPDSPLTWVTSHFPFTSSYVMPARLVFGEVAAWEPALSLGLLLLAILLVRRAAGRIFEFGILMHGKEPTWTEMWRAARGGRVG